MDNNAGSVVYLTAHAHSLGSAGFNLRLSENRSKAVRDYMMSKGIRNNRIIEKEPKNNKLLTSFEMSMGAEEENQKNRRVDVFVKDK